MLGCSVIVWVCHVPCRLMCLKSGGVFILGRLQSLVNSMAVEEVTLGWPSYNLVLPLA